MFCSRLLRGTKNRRKIICLPQRATFYFPQNHKRKSIRKNLKSKHSIIQKKCLDAAGVNHYCSINNQQNETKLTNKTQKSPLTLRLMTKMFGYLGKESKESKEAKSPIDNSKLITTKRLLELLRPETKYLIYGITALGVTTCTTLVFPAALGKIMDIVLLPDGFNQLKYIIAGLTGIFTIGWFAAFARISWFGVAAERIVMNLRIKLFEAYMKQEVAFFDGYRTGELISRLSTDTEIMSRHFIRNVAIGLRRIIEGIGGLGILMYMAPKLTLTMLLVVPPVAICGVAYGRYVRKLALQVVDALSRTTGVAEERISAIRTVRAFSQEHNEVIRYTDEVEQVYHKSVKMSLINGLFISSVTLAVEFAALAVLWHGSSLILAGEMTVGDLTSFLLYTMYVGFAFSGATSFYQEFIKTLGSTQRVFEFLDRTPAREMNPGGQKLDKVIGHIEFKDVTFSYPSQTEQLILKNFCLTLEPGKVLAIVGHSGSGKSTIASLFTRLYSPNSGTITLDGIELEKLDIQHIRERFIGVVPQDIVLFTGTIAENIAYGLPGATQEQIEDAARQSNAHDFIIKFKDGYNTVVGERGTTLSGGQKQRIGIARALVKNPTILLLDEATSALDVESEYYVQKALQRVMVGRTVIVIAHRLSTIKSSDYIAVLANGEVVEYGPYNDLITKDGEFKKLVDKQLTE
eukprot:TRINITY_DN3378_c0_g1_i4.p1 TRINITY_DN3378_c0_g1~~TRINITY_DN3378_c0_g1_i4.p1  ORF type:complete len:688 (+),score=99.48 TRINITY_DN3378_c0_g1_i4:64-2127(+)